MKRFALVLSLVALFSLPLPVSAYNDDTRAPAAFVEGTREYTIKFFDDMRPRLAKYYNKSRAAMPIYDELLKKTKEENVLLLGRIQKLQATGQFLKADDPALLNYRKTLNELTFHFFILIKIIVDENDHD